MRTLTTPMLLLTFALCACATDAPTTPSAMKPALDNADVFPDVISLPNGFAADGIGVGPGSTLYAGSLASGAIWRGDARTGAGSLLVPAQAGRSVCAIAYDARTNRLFAAGSETGQAYVYDAATGETLGVYQLADPASGATTILDVAVLRDGVYFTDSSRPVLYRIPLGANGQLPPQTAVQVLPYSGDFQFLADAINSTGIVATPDQRWLLSVNATTGALYRVDPATAHTTAIDLGGGSLPFGDGLALIGNTLYVAEVVSNEVAVVDLNADFTSGAVEGQALHSTALDFPSKIAVFGSALYAVNARFEVEPGPDVGYQVVRLSR